jgi:hypothetical protein
VADEAADILTADQRNVFAELLPVEFQQAAAMGAFLAGHFGEHLGAAGIFLAQSFGDIEVDAAVLFLVGDGKRQDFPLGQV